MRFLIAILLLTACGPSFVVTKVIDGDTFIYRGERVRIICIDAPELDQPGGNAARQALSALILNREVRLVRDVRNQDVYGRSLRYVYVNDLDIGAEMVRTGHATVMHVVPDIHRCPD
jgi:micrococcal nuclease